MRNELNYYANVTSVRKCFPLSVCVCVQYINKTLENLCRGQADGEEKQQEKRWKWKRGGSREKEELLLLSLVASVV